LRKKREKEGGGHFLPFSFLKQIKSFIFSSEKGRGYEIEEIKEGGTHRHRHTHTVMK